MQQFSQQRKSVSISLFPLLIGLVFSILKLSAQALSNLITLIL